MNEKFYSLPEEKQERIINAGFRVFSQNSYKKSPVREIADEAGISKSLLFHYFHDKRELYLFLWDRAADITVQYLARYGCYETGDLFEAMEKGMRAKLQIMRKYPDMAAFTIKAFYEKDEQVRGAVQESYRKHLRNKAGQTLAELSPEDFVPGLDLKMMYREMYLASEGYLWELLQRREELRPEDLERDFSQMMDFWKKIYCRKEQ